jgi:hypothetical protein
MHSHAPRHAGLPMDAQSLTFIIPLKFSEQARWMVYALMATPAA